MEKKIPMRMCVGCREMKPKRELVRIVCTKLPDDKTRIGIDPTGKAAGRGAYICLNAECLQRAKKSRALERAFSSKIEDDVYEGLTAAVERAAEAAKDGEHDCE